MKPRFGSFRSTLGSALTSVVMVSVATIGTSFADTSWTGGTADWNTPGNWDNNVPDDGAGNGTAWITNGGTAQITGSIAVTDWNLLVGSGGNGNLTQSTGLLQTGFNSENWMWVGDNGATGTYSLNGDGSLSTSRLQVGIINGGQGTVTINTTGSVSVGAGGGNWWDQSSIILGDSDSSSGTVNLQNGTVTATDTTWIGAFSGEATWNQTGGTFNATEVSVGRYGGGGTSTALLSVGGGTGTATVNTSGKIYVAHSGGAGDAYNADLTVNNNGTVNASADIEVGFGGTGAADLTINNGGVVNLSSTGNGVKWLVVGRYDSVNSTVTVNGGGTLNLNDGSDIRANQGGSGTKLIDVNGGLIQGSAGSNAELGPATMNVRNNGKVVLPDGLDAWDGTLNVTSGGVVEAAWIASGSGSGGNVYINGGTVRATQDQTGFINMWGAGGEAYIGANGATIDNAGYAISVTGAGDGLLEDPGSTGGGVTFTGSGTTTLATNNTYTGDTIVSAGTLLVSGALGATDVTVQSGATIGGDGSLLGSLAFASGANFLFDSLSTLDVSGTVSFGGFGIANLTGLDNTVDAGTYTLINGTVNFANVSNIGLENAVDLGGGKSAYLQEGSLQVVVVPEPGAAVIGSLGMFCLLRRRRRA